MTSAAIPPAGTNPKEKNMADQPKAGIKTSELWITLITVAGGVLTAVSTSLPAEWKIAALVCSGLAAAAYSISRGLAKK